MASPAEGRPQAGSDPRSTLVVALPVEKLKKAEALMSHRIPHCDLAQLIEAAIDGLIEKVEKERFATKPTRERKSQKQARTRSHPAATDAASAHTFRSTTSRPTRFMASCTGVP